MGVKDEDAKGLCRQLKEAKAAMIKSDQLQLSQGGSAPLAGSLRAGGGVWATAGHSGHGSGHVGRSGITLISEET